MELQQGGYPDEPEHEMQDYESAELYQHWD